MHVRASRALRSIVSCSSYLGSFGSGPVSPRPELGSSYLLHCCVLRVQFDLSCLVLRIRDLPALARVSQDSDNGAHARDAQVFKIRDRSFRGGPPPEATASDIG